MQKAPAPTNKEFFEAALKPGFKPEDLIGKDSRLTFTQQLILSKIEKGSTNFDDIEEVEDDDGEEIPQLAGEDSWINPEEVAAHLLTLYCERNPELGFKPEDIIQMAIVPLNEDESKEVRFHAYHLKARIGIEVNGIFSNSIKMQLHGPYRETIEAAFAQGIGVVRLGQMDLAVYTAHKAVATPGLSPRYAEYMKNGNPEMNDTAASESIYKSIEDTYVNTIERAGKILHKLLAVMEHPDFTQVEEPPKYLH